MAPPSHLRVERSPSRRHVVLRMENRIVNLGAGPAELFGRARLADRDARAAGDRRRRGAAAPDRRPGRAVLQVRALARRVATGSSTTRRASSCGRIDRGRASHRGWCAPGPSTTTACATSTACAPGPTASAATASSARATSVRARARSRSGRRSAGPTSIPSTYPGNWIDVTGPAAAASRSSIAPTPATTSSSPTRPTTSRSTIVRLPYKPGPQRCPTVQPVPPAPPVPTPAPPPAPAPPPPTPPPTV